ncbi:TauD/TfdA family dioxygenase [Kribbella sp. NBC_01505]|uniref:TauD/TfdA family dioxygenase n=1 Tax=Kribbella sp. NBC_01505 TaxID=2903580 RepID=UPI00386F3D8C
MASDQPGDSTGLRYRVVPGRPATASVPILTGTSDCCTWLDSVRTDIRLALDRHGALCLPGLPIGDPDDFAAVRDVLVNHRAGYVEKATPRTSYGDDVFSSTDLPAGQAIRLHNENSYTLTFPGLLLFGCLEAPGHGGATTIADCREVLTNVPPSLLKRFRASGWSLLRNYSDHYSLDWPTAFGTGSRADVNQYCIERLVGSAWSADGQLRTSQVRSAIIRHPRTGDEVWFNHVAFWSEWSLDPEIREILLAEAGPGCLPFNTAFGDGAAPTPTEIAAINTAYDRATVRHSWRPGDVLIVDNLRSAHGRDAFRGNRKIVVAMGDPVALADCSPTVAAAPGQLPATATDQMRSQ